MVRFYFGGFLKYKYLYRYNMTMETHRNAMTHLAKYLLYVFCKKSNNPLNLIEVMVQSLSTG